MVVFLERSGGRSRGFARVDSYRSVGDYDVETSGDRPGSAEGRGRQRQGQVGLGALS